MRLSFLRFSDNVSRMIKAEIITIGDEILIGQIVDTNSAFMAEQLNSAGIGVCRITSVSDNAEHIRNALNEASSRAEIIITTGGLGPTKDDITKSVLADYFGSAKTVTNRTMSELTEKRLAARGIPMNESNKKQADVPDNCTVIVNRLGTAPGMRFVRDGKIFVAMPGVPYETKAMLADVIDELKTEFELPHICHKSIMTYGISESALAEKIEPWENALPSVVKLAYLPNIETGVKLRLSSSTENGREIIDAEFAKLSQILGTSIYGYEPDTPESVVGKLLVKKGLTVSVAESFTGGRVANRITSIPGSSDYFAGGIVAYSNEAKSEILGVNSEDLKTYGAISERTAIQMAEGVRKMFKTDYGLSTTGIAGPGGGTPAQPVGLCRFAVAASDFTEVFETNYATGLRENIVAAGSSFVLNALRLRLIYTDDHRNLY